MDPDYPQGPLIYTVSKGANLLPFETFSRIWKGLKKMTKCVISKHLIPDTQTAIIRYLSCHPIDNYFDNSPVAFTNYPYGTGGSGRKKENQTPHEQLIERCANAVASTGPDGKPSHFTPHAWVVEAILNESAAFEAERKEEREEALAKAWELF